MAAKSSTCELNYCRYLPFFNLFDAEFNAVIGNWHHDFDTDLDLFNILPRLDFQPFSEPRSLPHTTAGSLVYPLYLLTNHREACSNRVGVPVMGQLCHLSIQHGGYQWG